MPGPNANAEAELQRQRVAAATQLGRFSGPEFLYSSSPAIAVGSGLTPIPSPGPLNITRPIESLLILVSLRLTVSVAPYTAVAPEAPQNFVQLVQLQGNHRSFGAQTPVRMSGATVYALGRLGQEETGGGEYLISKNGGALVKANQPGRPFTSAFDGTVATHDMIIAYHVPFSPTLMPSPIKVRQATNFLLQPADWGSTLQPTILVGDSTSFGDPTGATTALAGFGGVGNPLVQVFANYALLGDFQNKMQRSGLVVRNEQQLQSQTALTTNVQLAQLAHQITTLLVVKTGRLQAAGLTANVDTLATLTDLQLEAVNLQVDNKQIRNNIANMAAKAYHERMWSTIAPEGYLPFSFVESGSTLTAYRGDRLPGGSQWNVMGNVITANAQQRQRLLQEYVLGGPFPQ
jgi:hypothetical protein